MLHPRILIRYDLDMNEEHPRRYFDNAATTFPKPPGVSDAVRDYMEQIGASAGRGAYREAQESRQVLDDCRDACRRVLGAASADDVIFTLNGTDALNIAIKGLTPAGAHVVTTAMDHNSVLRPLNELNARSGVTFTVVPVDPHSTRLRVEDVAAAIRPETTLVAVNHASNVTGVLQPISDIAAVCRARNVPLLVDAAQSAGHVPIDFTNDGIDLLATPGHKGLLGPLGTGVLLIRAGLAEKMTTLREGGTGSESEKAVQPQDMPDKFEVGSHNAAGVAGLLVALRWLEARGVAALRQQDHEHCAALVEAFADWPGLTLFGPRRIEDRVGVFSVRVTGFDPHELANVLEGHFGVLSRAGLHCAPAAHQTINTDADGGTTRLSIGPFTTAEDIEVAIRALRDVSAAPAAR